MGRRLRASAPTRRPRRSSPVVTRKTHPHYLMCAQCGAGPFFKRELFEQHVQRKHPPRAQRA